jgi:hypothetical protein
MMDTFRIGWLDGERILLGKILAPFQMRANLDEAARRLGEMLDQASEPVPYILDLAELKTSFGDMVFAMGELTHEGAVWRHPNIKEMVIITESSMVKIGADALRQMQYGGVRTYTAVSLKEALLHLGVSLSKVDAVIDERAAQAA